MKVCQCFGQSVVEIIGLCDPAEVTVSVESQDADDCLEAGAWTQISVPELFRLPADKPDIGTIDKVFVEVHSISTRIVNTPIGPCPSKENIEGTRLTGKKLVIEGVLKQKIVYTAARPDQPVFTVHFDAQFSAFIVLASNAELKDFCVEACIEDVFAIPFNPREIFKNVTLFLQVKANRTDGCVYFDQSC
ncbi:conserved hypothetical protein [uncultured Sporomusa sp.]|uniref:SipL SPOCS domain-containing protein n=1 Tax=uncultured Sporomusa sp. TaxID=307249 RepID=A0A212LZ38_9FIRM|nr:DUF3794 domain-containing protein [uncultured Sporomusa sp.]SCM82791.1 conserved hypothetical protein [uncultured Sporomusa sp.]